MTDKILTEDDVVPHPESLALFWYQDRLLRVITANYRPIFLTIYKANSNFIQPIIKTDLQLDLQSTNYKCNSLEELYEHKVYNHRVRIQEMPITRAKSFIITLCQMHIELIKHGIVATDIHESNMVETVEGFKWLDYGAFEVLNKNTASIAFVLTCYLIYKYLYKNIHTDHEHICLDDIRSKHLSEPLSNMVELDFTNPDSWQELIKVIENITVTLDKSHWSDNYSNTMDIDHPENLGEKGINTWNILQEIEYNTATDVGCNKGYYSFLAAKKAKSVISFDLIPTCINIAQQFNEQFKLPIVFATKTIESIHKNECFETDRFKSDLVMALAIVHHIGNVITPENFTKVLSEISNKYVLIEDINNSADTYQKYFQENGFVLDRRVPSTPPPRTLSLYRKI